ncbi:Membrane alanyl aminopeptidase [Granulicella mallensis MP5ACTX8]|uniref:Aminopeptidase n=2 Tax=Granulicella mallensis TaxID=940614 RepID=G8NYM4_GRAMM|nr:Membrane alanyl aminopeptidase [Granulicella mallensis MP5ACTX8]
MAVLTAQAQRLSTKVLPSHYTLALTPDLHAATFHGEETIDITLAQPATAITLNAIEIRFGTVSVIAGGQTLPGTVSLNEKDQQATLAFPSTVPAGQAHLKISYDGILNNELHGFYLSKSDKRNYAVTQLEATDARRAFPSFDEPAMKATFDISLSVDKGDNVISNTNVVSDTPQGAEKHTITFARTPKMSTYLVAFLVGDFECQTGSADGIPIRACATPDKLGQLQFAVKTAEFVLHYYDTYFGIKYPMPKLDMIGIPDFEAGAMENFGAITYRETAILIDPQTATEGQKAQVAAVIAHEMAHQWFGDMVTMQWWDNLWLNEGFATWLEHKPVNALNSEWNIPQAAAEELDGALNYDAGRVTRTIRSKADTPDEINQQGDELSYGKAGGVLAMVENYIGEETFRQGVHNYLQAHMFGNATAEDFWNAQTANSHKPVDKIMESLIAQPGVPLLEFSVAAGGKTEVRQQRFYLSSSMKDTTGETWTLPVCFKTAGAPTCELLGAKSTSTLNVPAAPYLFANAAAKGYYRTVYAPADYARLVAHAETGLTAPERIVMLDNQWALVRAGKVKVGDFLDLVTAIGKDQDSGVQASALGSVGSIRERIADDADRDKLASWIRTTYLPLYETLGVPSPSDSPDKKQLRAQLFGLLGGAKDEAIITQSRELVGEFMKDPTSVDPTLFQAATAVAATNGDAAFYEHVLQASKNTQNPQMSEQALHLLAYFKDPELVTRTLDYATSGQVRNQDSWILLAIELQKRMSRVQTWQYVQQNWDKVKAQFTTASGAYVVGSTGAFCDATHRDEVKSFFASHPVPSSNRSLQRAVDQINDCIELHDSQEANLKNWLATNVP